MQYGNGRKSYLRAVKYNVLYVPGICGYNDAEKWEQHIDILRKIFYYYMREKEL